jgi:hypothetical protein
MATASTMRTAASALLSALPADVRSKVQLPFEDSQRRWIQYTPMSRPGAELCDLGTVGRKWAHRLLASALSPAAYAQANAVMALEEVLDRVENWRNGRRSDNYSVIVFGGPDDGVWGWRFEGHHLSVSMTLDGDRVAPTPVFLGANPARMGHAGAVVLRPLAPEEDVARALLTELGPKHRATAIVADEPPPDIRSGARAEFADVEPAGITAKSLTPKARELLWRLLHVYLGRLPADLAAAETARIDLGRLHFAWEGPIDPGGRHYYRVQSADLLIEYDNQDDGGNHAHTVLRRPGADFGDDMLQQHRARAHA